jgi:hypothetical protein
MPPHDGARLDDYQGGAPLRPQRSKRNPEEAVSSAKTRSGGRALQGGELLPERDILKNQLVMSTGSDRERATEHQNQRQHAVILALCATPNQPADARR